MANAACAALEEASKAIETARDVAQGEVCIYVYMYVRMYVCILKVVILQSTMPNFA